MANSKLSCPAPQTHHAPQISYSVGKKVGEQALWKFIEEENPAFTVTNFNPALLWGPPLQHVQDVQHLGVSSSLLYSIMTSAESADGKVPQTMFPGYVSYQCSPSFVEHTRISRFCAILRASSHQPID